MVTLSQQTREATRSAIAGSCGRLFGGLAANHDPRTRVGGSWTRNYPSQVLESEKKDGGGG